MARGRLGSPGDRSHLSVFSQWSKEEQSAAMATDTESTFQELMEWNARSREKFGFVFLICTSGRGTQQILAELKVSFLLDEKKISLVYGFRCDSSKIGLVSSCS
ncbi:unnamed protein product [Musa textilis]